MQKLGFATSCATKYATDALKAASKRPIQKTAKGADDFIGNKIADEIAKVSTTLPQNSSESVESEIENNGLDEKYQNIYMYLQVKDRKFLMI